MRETILCTRLYADADNLLLSERRTYIRIDWRKTNFTIFCLQKRLVCLAANGDISAVHLASNVRRHIAGISQVITC
jgi:hypothetical protein